MVSVEAVITFHLPCQEQYPLTLSFVLRYVKQFSGIEQDMIEIIYTWMQNQFRHDMTWGYQSGTYWDFQGLNGTATIAFDLYKKVPLWKMSSCLVRPLATVIWTHFSPMFQFSTTRKSQKTKGFLTFSGGIRMEHWAKMFWI